MLPREFKAFEKPTVYHTDDFKWARFCVIWNQLFGWVSRVTKVVTPDKQWSPYV